MTATVAAPTLTPAPLPTATAIVSAIAPASSAPAAGTPQVLNYSPDIPVNQLSQDANARPAPQTTTFDAAAGATIINNNVALSIPPGVTGNGSAQNLTVTLQPAGGTGPSSSAAGQPVIQTLTTPDGPARFDAAGTVFRVGVTDQAGNAVVAFAAPVTLAIKYSPTDLASANSDPSGVAAGYLVDTSTPALVNPDAFPPGSWVFFPASAVHIDPASSVITIQAQALGGAIAIFSSSSAFVQTIGPSAPLLSSFDPDTSQTFGSRPTATYLRVMEPQIGDRLLVMEQDTGGYAYVNAADVTPAGIPPSR